LNCLFIGGNIFPNIFFFGKGSKIFEFNSGYFKF